MFESLLHHQIVYEIRGCWCLHSPFRLTAIPETDSLSLSLPEGAVKFKRRPDHGPRLVVAARESSGPRFAMSPPLSDNERSLTYRPRSCSKRRLKSILATSQFPSRPSFRPKRRLTSILVASSFPSRPRFRPSKFTVSILKFSDLVKERTVLTVPGGPRFTPSAGR
jgi:hypothetical protein